MQEFLEALAVVLYGMLAIVLLFAFALHQGSTWGAAGAVTAAGLTYLFQAAAYERWDTSSQVVLRVLQGIVVLVFAVSLVVTVAGY